MPEQSKKAAEQPDYCYSANGDDYYYDYETAVEVASEYIDEGVTEVSIFRAIRKNFTHADFINSWSLENIIEHMQENAYEEVGEVAEDYLCTPTTSERGAEFKQVMAALISKHYGKDVLFFGIQPGTTEKLTVPVAES